MVDRQLLEPIDDTWEELGLDDKFPPSLVKAASTYDGKKYLLPITQHIVVFFYNTKVYEKAGSSPRPIGSSFLTPARS